METPPPNLDLDEDLLEAFNASDVWAEEALNSSGDIDQEEVPQSTHQIIETSKGDTEDPEPEHYEILRKYFGHQQFKPMQWKIIRSILVDNQDNCAVMATGYGKSLCYQFPPVFTGGIALVVSPLISLMQDQILALTVANIPACLLGSANDKKNKTVVEIFEGKYKLVYFTPELCSSEYGRGILEDMRKKLQISLIAIDEAHCVSTWGNDFRFQYRNLGVLKNIFNCTPTLALTATATEQVRKDIITSLKLKNPQILCSGFDRPNLYLSASLKAKISVMQQLHPFMTFVDGKYQFLGPTIIYCITKKDTETFADILKCEKIDCAAYHAGMTIETRKEIHEKFVKDKINCIVATIAFGMGIDKPDIRTVIHWGASRTIESYYQEVGRAGRDGQPAKCHTFYNVADFSIHRFLREKSQLTSNLKKLQENMSKKMQDYLDTINCRRKFLLNHFQENLKHDKVLPNCCDNCTKKLSSSGPLYKGVNNEGKYDFSEDTFTFLNVVSNLNGRFGLEKIVLFLRGSQKMSSYQNDTLFGCGKSNCKDWWRAVSRMLEKESFIKKVKNNIGTVLYFTIECTKFGLKYLSNYKKDKSSCQILLVPIPEMIPFLKKVASSTSVGANHNVYTAVQLNEPSSSTINSTNLTSKASESKQKGKPEEASKEVLDLYRILLDKRTEIASHLDIMPYVIASNEALMKMAELVPRNIRSLRAASLPGFTEAKIEKFAQTFIDTIILKIGPDANVKSSNECSSLQNVLIKHPLGRQSFGTSAQKTFTYFKQGMSVKEISESRGLVQQTILSHLTEAMKQGYPVKMSELGIGEEIINTIINIIKRPPINNNTTLLTPIKMQCPENITYAELKVVVTYVQVREHLKEFGVPYNDFEDFSYESFQSLSFKEEVTNKQKETMEKYENKHNNEVKPNKEENRENLSQDSALNYLLELADASNSSSGKQADDPEDFDKTVIDEDVINSFFEDSMELPPPKKICNRPFPKKKCNEVLDLNEIFSAINSP